MAETFLVLLTAHLLGDFVLQTRHILIRKKNPAVLTLHVVIVTLASAALLGAWHIPILSAIFITHLLMDAVKVYWLPKTATVFLFDQGVHVFVIAALAVIYATAFSDGAWSALLGNVHQAQFLKLMTLLSGLILGIAAGGVLIDMAAKKLLAQLSDTPDLLRGLENGGRYIGWLERALIMLLYFIGEPAGIGFLLAAKSILRFGDVHDSGQRKVAEYIIIGTLMSFGWALLIAVLTMQVLTMWRL
jgi:hypothetical protein